MSRLILLYGIACCLVNVQSLECGITEQLEDENMQRAFHKCMTLNKTETTEKPVTSTNETSPNSGEETSTPVSSHHHARRGRDAANITSAHEEGRNESSSFSNCLLQCIFSELGMVDSNGFPEHQSVAQGLLKNVSGRELRDFVQDSTDECFQQLEQGEKFSKCEHAVRLVTCLAEKGRSNCADWQIMNLPFHT